MEYKVQKPCKVCGKIYTPCSDCENDKIAFRWRKVACSMECGRKYFEMVQNERNKVMVTIASVTEEKVNEHEKVVQEEKIEEMPKIRKRNYKANKNNEESEQID